MLTAVGHRGLSALGTGAWTRRTVMASTPSGQAGVRAPRWQLHLGCGCGVRPRRETAPAIPGGPSPRGQGLRPCPGMKSKPPACLAHKACPPLCFLPAQCHPAGPHSQVSNVPAPRHLAQAAPRPTGPHVHLQPLPGSPPPAVSLSSRSTPHPPAGVRHSLGPPQAPGSLP